MRVKQLNMTTDADLWTWRHYRQFSEEQYYPPISHDVVTRTLYNKIYQNDITNDKEINSNNMVKAIATQNKTKVRIGEYPSKNGNKI